jgi:hypothetical protein
MNLNTISLPTKARPINDLTNDHNFGYVIHKIEDTHKCTCMHTSILNSFNMETIDTNNSIYTKLCIKPSNLMETLNKTSA